MDVGRVWVEFYCAVCSNSVKIFDLRDICLLCFVLGNYHCEERWTHFHELLIYNELKIRTKQILPWLWLRSDSQKILKREIKEIRQGEPNSFRGKHRISELFPLDSLHRPALDQGLQHSNRYPRVDWRNLISKKRRVFSEAKVFFLRAFEKVNSFFFFEI